MHNDLNGKIALVTGSTRGVGRGVAVGLGRHGATVYVTGRTSGPGQSSLPGNTVEVARAVTDAGGRGVPVTCDFGDDAQIAALVEQIERDEGKLDILVNNAVIQRDELTSNKPFWEQSLETADMFHVGVRSSFVTSWYCAPLLLKSGRGLIVNTSTYGAVAYIQNPAWGIHKASQDKLAADLAVEFAGRNVAAFSFWYGSVGTERHQAHMEQTQDARYADHIVETPEYSAHVMAALYSDPELFERSGQTFIVAELAREYGIKDEGGIEPPSYRDHWCGPVLPHPLPVVRA